MSNELRTTTRGENVFELVDKFSKENDFQWSKIVVCTTDGAPAKLGQNLGFQTRVKAVSPSVISVHYFLHRIALAAKLLPPNLKKSLNLAFKMVNYIKTSALNSRHFKVICKDIRILVIAISYGCEMTILRKYCYAFFVLRKELLQFF